MCCLENHYVEAARVLQHTAQARLGKASKKRRDIHRELDKGCWWNDLFAWCHALGDSRLQSFLVNHTEAALLDMFNDHAQNNRTFPRTNTVDGINIALSMRIQRNSFFSSFGLAFRSLWIDQTIPSRILVLLGRTTTSSFHSENFSHCSLSLLAIKYRWTEK